MMKAKYAEKVLSGEKTATIRPGKAYVRSREFFIHAGGKIVARAVLESVEYKRLRDLDDEHAKADGFGSVDELKRELKRLYPRIKEHDWVTIVRFRVVEKIDKPETKSYGGLSAIQVARLALENLSRIKLSKEEEEILRVLVETGSLRATARKIYGSIMARKKVRATIWRVLDRMRRIGLA